MRIVKAVVDSNPVTYRDIFDLILFSKEYLFEVERPKKMGRSGSIQRLIDMKQPPFIENKIKSKISL
jgi:hypothetical protein